MSKVQTDNSFFADKVMMRFRHLPEKKCITVLDAFAGDGLIWKKIREMSDKKITVISLDQKPDKNGVYLHGDNVKFLAGMDLERFDVIDLDAYGVPYHQLRFVMARASRGTVIYMTYIQSYGPTGGGSMPHQMLKECGYSRSMIKKIPSLFTRNGLDKMKYVLALRGVEKIHIKTSGQKHYMCFTL